MLLSTPPIARSLYCLGLGERFLLLIFRLCTYQGMNILNRKLPDQEYMLIKNQTIYAFYAT